MTTAPYAAFNQIAMPLNKKTKFHEGITEPINDIGLVDRILMSDDPDEKRFHDLDAVMTDRKKGTKTNG